MKQTVEERRLYHQTREDRQREALLTLQKRAFEARHGRGFYPDKLPLYEREIANLSYRLGMAE